MTKILGSCKVLGWRRDRASIRIAGKNPEAEEQPSDILLLNTIVFLVRGPGGASQPWDAEALKKKGYFRSQLISLHPLVTSQPACTLAQPAAWAPAEFRRTEDFTP